MHLFGEFKVEDADRLFLVTLQVSFISVLCSCVFLVMSNFKVFSNDCSPSLMRIQFSSSCFSACKKYRPSVHRAALSVVITAVPD